VEVGGEKMKKNTKKIATLVLLCVVAIGSYLVSGTYAKYTSKIRGYDDVDVAKWAWEINNTEITTMASAMADNAFTIDLLDTVYDSTWEDNEQDVDTGYIAPGMSGGFLIDITNLSEVNAVIGLELTEVQSNLPGSETLVVATGTATATTQVTYGAIDRIPIQYCTAGDDCDGDESKWHDAIEDANIEADVNNGGIAIDMNHGEQSLDVRWRWKYYDTDEQDVEDTRVGFQANSTPRPNVQVIARVVLVQVD
jgi:hypothetical protein